ncbi:MAG TPA: hypothetical protein VFF26_12720 [Gallionella sp.]|nr:hypothetical protein [Gallionella sp.]
MNSLIAYFSILLGIFILWLLAPIIHFGFTDSALHDSGFRIAFSASFLIPYILRLFFSPSRCKPQWRIAVNFLTIAPMIIMPVGVLLSLLDIVVGLLFLLPAVACSVLIIFLWRKAISPEYRSSPARDVYDLGLNELYKEKQPTEKRKIAVALKRFKDDWRLK